MCDASEMERQNFVNEWKTCLLSTLDAWCLVQAPQKEHGAELNYTVVHFLSICLLFLTRLFLLKILQK